MAQDKNRDRRRREPQDQVAGSPGFTPQTRTGQDTDFEPDAGPPTSRSRLHPDGTD